MAKRWLICVLIIFGCAVLPEPPADQADPIAAQQAYVIKLSALCRDGSKKACSKLPRAVGLLDELTELDDDAY